MATIDLGRIKPVWQGTWAGSTAYEVEDIVRHGVDTYICTTAHTSDATTFSNDSANWETMAQGADIPSQSGQAGKALVTDGTSLSWGNGGLIVKATRYYNNTRIAHSNSASTRIYNINFTKQSSSDETYIHVQAGWTQYGTAADFCGLYCDMDDTYYGTTDSWAFLGCGYSDNGEQNVGWINKYFDFASLDAGSHTVNVGWRARNNDAGNRPGSVWNPNAADDSRCHQTGFHMLITEIAKV